MIDLIKQSVLPHFGISAEEAKVTSLGNGHINDTFLVRWSQGELVLQKLNTQVFSSPEHLVNNAAKIALHLRNKRLAGDYKLQVVEPFRTLDGVLSIDLGEQGFWRAINYLHHSHSIDVVKTADEAFAAAKAFGHFSRALSNFDATQLDDVIPDFHHLPGRIEQLQQAVASDPHNRLAGCRKWVELVSSQQALLDELAVTMKNLPLRICHNDTKINNMLFDKRDMTSLAIIDLDTCMKGYLMHDFGDLVRSCCSPEEEDSTALDKVHVREAIFAELCRGYLSELGDVLTAAEKASLWLGIRLISFELATRFLTDHINGDLYFHIHHENHNLERAANQFTLYLSLLAQEKVLKPYLD